MMFMNGKKKQNKIVFKSEFLVCVFCCCCECVDQCTCVFFVVCFCLSMYFHVAFVCMTVCFVDSKMFIEENAVF